MSRHAAPADLSPASADGVGTPRWRVRSASPRDIGAVAEAIGQLLLELGGTPPARQEMEATTRALVEDEGSGAVLVAHDDEGAVIGVLAASWQTAIHAAGQYGLIQDLWVHPAWRSRQVGAKLVQALDRVARERGVQRIEVGLPRESFPALAATEAFYRRNGFTPLGPRMRRTIG